MVKNSSANSEQASKQEVVVSAPIASQVPTLVTLPEGMDTKYRVKGKITVPQLKQKIGETVYVRFTSAMSKAEDRVDPVTGNTMKGPWVAHVVDLQTGEECTYVLNAYTKSALEKIEYVGKNFAIRKNDPVTDRPVGRRFCPTDIVELE